MIIKYRNVRREDRAKSFIFLVIFFSSSLYLLVFLYSLSLNLLWKKLFFFLLSALSYRVIVIVRYIYRNTSTYRYWKLNNFFSSFFSVLQLQQKRTHEKENVFSTEDYSIFRSDIENCWCVVFFFSFIRLSSSFLLPMVFNIFYSYESGLVLWFEWTIRDYIMEAKIFRVLLQFMSHK